MRTLSTRFCCSSAAVSSAAHWLCVSRPLADKAVDLTGHGQQSEVEASRLHRHDDRHLVGQRLGERR